MKKVLMFAAGCLAASGLLGCSPAETTPSNSNTTAANTANISNAQPGNSQPSANLVNGGPDKLVPGMNAPADGQPANVEPGDNPAATTKPAPPTARTAPEDSEFTAVLKDVGLETRTFKNHPQIDKVERITSPGKKVIKVYLKGGKVVELPGDAIKNLKTAHSSTILSAAGMAPAQPPQKSGTKDAAADKVKN